MKKYIALSLVFVLMASCCLRASAQALPTITQEFAGRLDLADDVIDFGDLLPKVKVQSVVFAPITIMEETAGQWIEDASGKYYHYDWQELINYKVTFSNKITKTYTGTQFTYREKDYTLSFTDPQSAQMPWAAGNTYQVYITVGEAIGTVAITIEAKEGMPGDFTGDKVVDNEDVIYLLWHTMFPDGYPLTADGDVNGDGKVDNEDVIYLLWHTMFPSGYPLA